LSDLTVLDPMDEVSLLIMPSPFQYKRERPRD